MTPPMSTYTRPRFGVDVADGRRVALARGERGAAVGRERVRHEVAGAEQQRAIADRDAERLDGEGHAPDLHVFGRLLRERDRRHGRAIDIGLGDLDAGVVPRCHRADEAQHSFQAVARDLLVRDLTGDADPRPVLPDARADGRVLDEVEHLREGDAEKALDRLDDPLRSRAPSGSGGPPSRS